MISFLSLLHAVSKNDVSRFTARAGGAGALLHFGPKTTPSITAATEFESDQGLERHGFGLQFAGGDKLLLDGEWFTEVKAGEPDNPVQHLAAGGQFSRPWE